MTAGPTVSDSGACAVAPAASVTVAVKATGGGLSAAGTPVNTPVGLKVNPEPASPAADHAKGAVPPVSTSGCE